MTVSDKPRPLYVSVIQAVLTTGSEGDNAIVPDMLDVDWKRMVWTVSVGIVPCHMTALAEELYTAPGAMVLVRLSVI